MGNSSADPRGLIVSAPPNPDNFRQTIVQPASPPELRIPSDLKLPNIVIGNFTSPPPEKSEPPLKFETQSLSESQPIPLNLNKPLQPPSAAPVPVSLKLPPVEVPHLEVPLPSPPVPAQPAQAPQSASLSDLGIRGTGSTSGKALFSLSVDPGPASELVELPPGNRYGSFTIGAAAALGSPGGVAGGTPGGGRGGGLGLGGDSSSGSGPGLSGGGGGAAGDNGTVGVTSSRLAAGAGGGALSPLTAASLVYPIAAASRPRQSRMLVTSGPGGGGGLSVYGVLRGKKIYTIYLPMPGKNWILQYCESQKSPQNEPVVSRNVQIFLDPGLVPPSVEDQFDFHRTTLPKEKMNEMIVLHGLILEDGSVAELKVLRGLEGVADEAAIVAFGRWKFKPALRAGSPVKVEVLVGIPAM